jgi:hypothetical protein
MTGYFVAEDAQEKHQEIPEAYLFLSRSSWMVGLTSTMVRRCVGVCCVLQVIGKGEGLASGELL